MLEDVTPSARFDSTDPPPTGRELPPQSIEELARAQGVKPAEDLEELASLWPEGADPDDLDAFLARHRATRRTAARAGTQK
jgi:hypothetical protein